MSKGLPKKEDNFSAWYNELVKKADLAENSSDDGIFASSGTFSVVCPYEINQGARMVISEDEPSNTLNLAKGSQVPNDIENLVGLLHKTMPKELFDPSNHAIDTTYLAPRESIPNFLLWPIVKL